MKRKMVKWISIVGCLLISFFYTVKWLDSINIHLDPKTVDALISSSSNLNTEGKIVNLIVETIRESDYIDPVAIILNQYSTSSMKEKEPNDFPFLKPDSNSPSENPSQDKEDKEENHLPTVYIYNTHQGEKYSESSALGIQFSVLDAGYFLQTELTKYGIHSLVENGSIQDILNTNHWNYASSYRVSRMYLENAKKNNPSLNFYIDLHRDSVAQSITIKEIENKIYARPMFLLGLENPTYAKNEVVMQEMENWLNQNYPGLSRGIYRKQGPGNNGVYNQDFDTNCILIEVGGQYNTKEEVANTLEVLAKMLSIYLEAHS